jgi:hypothetical protein
MKFRETLSEATINYLVTSFSSIKQYLPKGWIDSTQPMEPFGSNWGRGVFSLAGEAIVTLQGTKHAQIRQRVKETDFTFYWGYIPTDKTLYLEIASIRGNGFSRKNVPVIVSSILDRMKYTWNVEQKNIIFESNNSNILSI